MTAFSVWLGIASLLSFCGAQKAAAALYPYYTEAMETAMLHEPDPLKAENLADRILRGNPLLFEAYNVKARAMAGRKDWFGAIEMKHRALSVNRLEGKEYDEYFMYIDIALQQAAENDDVDACIAIVDMGLLIPDSPILSSKSRDYLKYLADYKPLLRTVKEALD